jgi:hypothetical protein
MVLYLTNCQTERIATLIGRLFHVRRRSLRAHVVLLHRVRFTLQVRADRAAEGDEAAIAALREGDLGRASRLGARPERTCALKTTWPDTAAVEGTHLTPRGHTPSSLCLA